MTSMPASRSALAIIFAPLSWPSRPGFAITTRIFRRPTPSVYERATHGHRLLPRLAEPRQRPVRLPPRGPGGSPPRRRPRRPRPPARARARGGRRRHHALPPRPLRRHRPVGVVHGLLAADPRDAARAVASPGGDRGARRLRRLLGRAVDVGEDLHPARVRGGTPLRGGRLRDRGRPAAALRHAGLRLPRLLEREDPRLLRRLRARARARRARARRRPLPRRGDALARRQGRRAARTPLGRGGARGGRRAGAPHPPPGGAPGTRRRPSRPRRPCRPDLIRPATIDDAAAVASIAARSWRAAYAELLPAGFFERLDAAEASLWREYLEAKPAGAGSGSSRRAARPPDSAA